MAYHLKPCPFCGSNDPDINQKYIKCKTCGGQMQYYFQLPVSDEWNTRVIEDGLRKSLKEAIEWMEQAPFDYHNGITDPAGLFDEGNVYGWKGHHKVVDQMKKALDENYIPGIHVN